MPTDLAYIVCTCALYSISGLWSLHMVCKRFAHRIASPLVPGVARSRALTLLLAALCNAADAVHGIYYFTVGTDTAVDALAIAIITTFLPVSTLLADSMIRRCVIVILGHSRFWRAAGLVARGAVAGLVAGLAYLVWTTRAAAAPIIGATAITSEQIAISAFLIPVAVLGFVVTLLAHLRGTRTPESVMTLVRYTSGQGFDAPSMVSIGALLGRGILATALPLSSIFILFHLSSALNLLGSIAIAAEAEVDEMLEVRSFSYSSNERRQGTSGTMGLLVTSSLSRGSGGSGPPPLEQKRMSKGENSVRIAPSVL